jgi:hypothetical protein
MKIAIGVFLTLFSLASVATATSILTGESITSDFQATGFGVYAGPVVTTAPATISPYPGISSNGTFSVTYTDSTITLLSAGGSTLFDSGYTFNGIVFDLPANFTFSSATIDGATTLSGFVAGDLSFAANVLQVNLDALTFNSGNQLVLDVNGSTSAAPEPGTLALGAGGMVLVGFLRRLRRA